MNRISFSLLALALSPALSAADVIHDRDSLNLILGDNLVLEDFESFELPDRQGEPLDVFRLDSETVTNGQGPGLVEPRVSYVDPSEFQLYWYGNDYFGLESRALGSGDEDGRLWVLYDVPMVAVGVDLKGFLGYAWDGVVEIYGTGDVLLGTVPVSLSSGGPESVFVGWEDLGGDGIVRMEVSSPTYTWSPLIDNHGYGIPAPGTLPVLALVGLRCRRRR